MTSDILDFVLSHSEQPYDPIKRREYYLRTRELKGRAKGAEDDSPKSESSTGPQTSTFESNIEERQKESEKRQEEVKQRITQLKVKLEELKNVLRKLVAEAKLRSGVKPEDIEDEKSKDSPNNTGSKPKRELTEAEKAEAAEAAKERREEEASKTDDQRIVALEAQIAETKAKIEVALANARKQIAEAEQKSGSEDKEP